MSKKEKKSIIDKAMDYMLEMIWKLFLEVLKLLWKVFKKGCSNVITIKRGIANIRGNHNNLFPKLWKTSVQLVDVKFS